MESEEARKSYYERHKEERLAYQKERRERLKAEGKTEATRSAESIAKRKAYMAEYNRRNAEKNNARRREARAAKRALEETTKPRKTVRGPGITISGIPSSQVASFVADADTRRKQVETQIRRSTEGGEHEKIPGMRYAPGQIKVTHCAMCHQMITIYPRTHPWWIRRDDGSVVWLCKGCGGSSYRTAKDYEYLHEH